MDRKFTNKTGAFPAVFKDAVSQTPFGSVYVNMSPRSTFCTRRNKCLIFSLLGCSVFIILFINSGLYYRGGPRGELCKLSDIELEEDFDKERFAGNWYGAFTKGMTNSLIGKLLEFYDVKIKFILKDDGNFDIKSVGGKFLGVWCPEGEGHANILSEDTPQKLSVFFDTPTGKKLGTKPGWVLKTDYTSYAVIYSCWEETPSGHCAAPYAVVVTKSTKKLPPETLKVIHDVVNGACMDAKALKPIVHEGYCKKTRDSYD